MILLIRSIFNEIAIEARKSEIKILDFDAIDGFYTQTIRLGFNIVENENTHDILPNLHIKNRDSFFNKLSEYVYISLNKYQMDNTVANIKRIITSLLSNISEKEMLDLESYVDKYLSFITDNKISERIFETDFIDLDIGSIKGETCIQTYHQETPYSFVSRFENVIDGEEVKFYLPRISYGIKDNTCYIYAIQNKDRVKDENECYNSIIKKQIRSINSGVKKYRNVTPSFIIALSFFFAVLEKNGINDVFVVPHLPLREQNRRLVTEQKIKVETMGGRLSLEELENFKKELEEKRININQNVGEKFKNCFSRLQIHFEDLFLKGLNINDEIIYQINGMRTEQEFLKKIVLIEKEYSKS